MSHPHELRIPDAVSADAARATELARVWAAGGKLHVALATGLWEDPASWGIMLVDLARHVANAYVATTDGLDRDGVLERIKAGFDAEWSQATGTAEDVTP